MMKNLVKSSHLFLLLFLCLTSCEKKESVPLIKSTETKIGTVGGSISTPSGSVTIAVPAGALDKDVAVKIETIAEIAPQGIGAAQKLSPEGTQFQKSVTLTFKYDEAELKQKKTYPELLRIATRETNGKWETLKKVKLDKANKTISVETSHFSDWSIIGTDGGISLEIGNSWSYADLSSQLSAYNRKDSCYNAITNGGDFFDFKGVQIDNAISANTDKVSVLLHLTDKTDITINTYSFQWPFNNATCPIHQKKFADLSVIPALVPSDPKTYFLYTYGTSTVNGSIAYPFSVTITAWGNNPGDLLTGTISGKLEYSKTLSTYDVTGSFAFIRQ
jgi:hypothetical protein